MTKTWISAIYDRTYWDVQDASAYPDQTNPKGCWNAVDLNRIENNTVYCAEYMYEQRIVRSPIEIVGPSFEEWTANMIPTKTEIDRILNNVRLLVELSSENPAIASKLPTIYAATQINYILANDVEYALELMHNQPQLPLAYWNLTINNGLIHSIRRLDGTVEEVFEATALVAENESVIITGEAPGEHPEEQTFTYWSGQAADIALLNDYQSEMTSFVMPYRNVTFTANYESHTPRTLTITSGYISISQDPTAASGPSSGTYYAGDQIMIIANVAPLDKEFYTWTGTQAALNNLVGSTESADPSTAILTMPDCDVSLVPQYINAGQHRVTVTNGTVDGQSSKLFDYGETGTITASVPSHHAFTNWSGDTSYLSDIYNPTQTFTMGENPISFRANYSYVYSYNDVEVINGKIRVNGQEVTSAQGLRQSTSYTLIPTPPDSSQGLDYWQVTGYGSVSGNTFYVGDGDAIITGHYNYIRTLTVINKDNSANSVNYTAIQGHSWGTIYTSSKIGDYRFKRWEENGTQISTSTSISLTAGESDRTITAVYEYEEPPPSYTVTFKNQNNGGQTTTSSVQQGGYWSRSSDEEVGNYMRTGWYKDDTYQSNNSSYGFYVYADTTIEVKYRPKETYTLTIQNGYITATGETTGQFLERASVGITADAAPTGMVFVGWSTTSGSIYSSTSSATGTIKMGSTDATLQAQYRSTRQITVITDSGTTTYTVTEGYSQYITASPVPTDYTFTRWEVVSGDATISSQYSTSTYVYAQLQDSTIRAIYTAIPDYTVTMVDGYVWDGSAWQTTAQLRSGANNEIILRQGAVPLGMQFLQWEVYVNGQIQTSSNEVASPYAERSRLYNVHRDITVKATFYAPDPDVTYTLSIERKDGTVDQHNYAVGTDVSITASTPISGYVFYRWTGDTAFISGGRYEANSAVRMPAQNVYIKETFIPQGYVPQYELVMGNTYGKCCYETESEDPETGQIITTEHWVSRYSYPEGATVKIKAEGWDPEYQFNYWKAYELNTGQNPRDITSIITNSTSAVTTLTMPDTDVSATPNIGLRPTKPLLVNGGGTSGNYYEGKRADIYFGLTNSNDIHYEFTRWIKGENSEAELNELELWDGGTFNTTTPGTQALPQYIKMPNKGVEVTATYKTLYRLTLVNGTIDSTSTSQEYYETGTSIAITADTAPTGTRFQYWSGDVDVLANKYDPTTTLTTVTGTTTLTAVYSADTERNNVGYVTSSLKNSNTVNEQDIQVIAGEIDVGFVLTDSNGHIYIITSLDTTSHQHTIYRLTKIVQGGNTYG